MTEKLMKTIITLHSGLNAFATWVFAFLLVLASMHEASAQINNTRTGANALSHIVTGDDNTADGWSALQCTNTGVRNTAVGSGALQYNTLGNSNTAVGWGALTFSNTNGN